MDTNPKIRIFKFYPVYEKNATLPRAEYLILDNEECGSVGEYIEEYIEEYIDDGTYGEVYYWNIEEVFYDSGAEEKRLLDKQIVKDLFKFFKFDQNSENYRFNAKYNDNSFSYYKIKDCRDLFTIFVDKNNIHIHYYLIDVFSCHNWFIYNFKDNPTIEEIKKDLLEYFKYVQNKVKEECEAKIKLLEDEKHQFLAT